MSQGDNESLRKFVQRFSLTINKIFDINISVAVTTLIQGTRDLDLRQSLARKLPVDQVKLFSLLQKYIQQEETLNTLQQTNNPA